MRRCGVQQMQGVHSTRRNGASARSFGTQVCGLGCLGRAALVPARSLQGPGGEEGAERCSRTMVRAASLSPLSVSWSSPMLSDGGTSALALSVVDVGFWWADLCFQGGEGRRDHSPGTHGLDSAGPRAVPGTDLLGAGRLPRTCRFCAAHVPAVYLLVVDQVCAISAEICQNLAAGPIGNILTNLAEVGIRPTLSPLGCRPGRHLGQPRGNRITK